MESADRGKKPLQNHLGILGWVWAGRYKMERYLYTLHRLTGVGLAVYIAIHLIANGFRLGGEDNWTDIMDLFGNSGFRVGEYLVMAAFIIHALNGGRLILQHLGVTLGKPKPSAYPYVDSLRRNRFLTWVILALIVALAIYTLLEFVIG